MLTVDDRKERDLFEDERGRIYSSIRYFLVVAGAMLLIYRNIPVLIGAWINDEKPRLLITPTFASLFIYTYMHDIISLFCGPGNLIETVEEFNLACEHIVSLLEEAEVVYSRGGYSTSAFLAITAIEEVAKAHLGLFTAGGSDSESRYKNVFYNHAKKHKMAATPTISMGKRLQEAIGEEALSLILEMSRNKKLLDIRESSLYFQRYDGTVKTPRTCIDKDMARSILLYAIEVFDDALAGFTDYSMKTSQRTDLIFSRIGLES